MTADDMTKGTQDALEQGQRAARLLADALTEIGFCFPSLMGDFPAGRKAHVRLGGMAADEVIRFAEWIRKHA